jgi:hypothetical protein
LFFPIVESTDLPIDAIIGGYVGGCVGGLVVILIILMIYFICSRKFQKINDVVWSTASHRTDETELLHSAAPSRESNPRYTHEIKAEAQPIA